MSKKQKEKMDLWSIKANNKFDEVLGFANKYKSIPEVQEVISALQTSYQNYEHEIENLISSDYKKIMWLVSVAHDYCYQVMKSALDIYEKE